MLYLLGVIFAAVRLGRGPGVLLSFLSVAAFDFFFVPPRLSFSVSDTQYLLTFVVMLLHLADDQSPDVEPAAAGAALRRCASGAPARCTR